jgi:CubicO group peptidase (beta-lactamase class C family)
MACTPAGPHAVHPPLTALPRAAKATPAAAWDFPKGDPTSEGIDPAALASLLDRAQKTSSDVVVIIKNGKLVGEWHFGTPEGTIEAMSATKSVVSVAIGILLDRGKIRSIDDPIYTYFPEWNQGKKKLVTLRMILDHTSGVQADARTDEIYASPDFVKLALAAELTTDPGTTFFYNNKAVNLLAAIVQAASGQRMDLFIRDVLFTPLGITDFKWNTDKAGNPQVMAGLEIRAKDFARIGQMLADAGTWQGRRIVSASWIATSTTPTKLSRTHCALLWWPEPEWRRLVLDDWLFAEWRKRGVAEAFIDKVMPMKDHLFTVDQPGFEAFHAGLISAFGSVEAANEWDETLSRPDRLRADVLTGPIVGFTAEGFLGQYLVVFPAARLVAVRQRRAPDGPFDESKIDSFGDFTQMVRALVPTKPSGP